MPLSRLPVQLAYKNGVPLLRFLVNQTSFFSGRRIRITNKKDSYLNIHFFLIKDRAQGYQHVSVRRIPMITTFRTAKWPSRVK